MADAPGAPVLQRPDVARRPTDLVNLSPLMALTRGSPEVGIGLIDGPVATGHPGLSGSRFRWVRSPFGGCSLSGSSACDHGTFVAGILAGQRGSGAPSICPGCTLLVRPIFGESGPASAGMPTATQQDLALAIRDTVAAGARVINISAAMVGTSAGTAALTGALDAAQARGVIVVVASGNQARVGGSTLTGHPWVLPVVAYDRQGRPAGLSSLAGSIGRRGLGAPGASVRSLAPPDRTLASGGTSVAAPFVTGAVALLWSAFPGATAGEVRMALTGPASARRSVVPPLLDAWAAYRVLARLRTSRVGRSR